MQFLLANLGLQSDTCLPLQCLYTTVTTAQGQHAAQCNTTPSQIESSYSYFLRGLHKVWVLYHDKVLQYFPLGNTTKYSSTAMIPKCFIAIQLVTLIHDQAANTVRKHHMYVTIRWWMMSRWTDLNEAHFNYT